MTNWKLCQTCNFILLIFLVVLILLIFVLIRKVLTSIKIDVHEGPPLNLENFFFVNRLDMVEIRGKRQKGASHFDHRDDQ